MKPSKITTLDVREDFRAGQAPCEKILLALGQVGPNEALRLLVPFKPVPLFEVAAGKGLTHSETRTSEGDWEVRFTRSSVPTPATATAAAPPPPCGCGCSTTVPAETLDLDARGLEPPQPMVKILETLTTLPANAALRARTDRRPIHLYALLQARGFAGESEEQPDGSFLTHIRRR